VSDVALVREQRWVKRLFPVLLVTVASGLITYLDQGHGVWQQFTALLHVLAGVVFAILLLPHLSAHLVRTIGLRRPIMSLFGGIVTLVILANIISGAQIAVWGQSEALRWVYTLHLGSTWVVMACLSLHLLAHRLFISRSRRRLERSWFPSLGPGLARTTGLALLLAVGSVTLATVLYQQFPVSYAQGPAVTPYELPYGEQPFWPSQTETETGGFVDPRQLSGAERCGNCHPQIFSEWQASMHSQAASDRAYQTNINLLAASRGMAATRYCEGCHAPVPLLSGQLTSGGKLATPGHLKEGVGCRSCHNIDRVVHLKGVGSFRLALDADYLFQGRDTPILTAIHDYLIRIQSRQHRRDMSRPPLGAAQMCATCHVQFMDKEMNDWGWVKMQDEYSDWLSSPYSGNGDPAFSQRNVQRCQDCHFPLTAGQDPSSDSSGRLVSHHSLGANTAIPYLTGDTGQQQRVTQFLMADRIRITIDPERKQNATRSGKPLDHDALPQQDPPPYAHLGDQVIARVVVQNSGVGHEFPGGTIDINQVWLHLRVVDGQGKLVYESGAMDAKGNVDASAHRYGSIPIDRSGKHVWRHDLFNMIGDSYRNVIGAGKADVLRYSFTVPYWAKTPLTLSAAVNYRKFNQKYAHWALKDDTLSLPVVTMARASEIIHVRYVPEVEDAP
jgi:hypothetical protein